jgi:hypothetical protein
MSEVAEASKEQSQGIGQITTAMSEMDKVTQSNAASAAESAGAAGQLSRQAGNRLEAVEDMTALVHGAGSGAGGRRASGRLPAPAARPAKAGPGAGKAAIKALPLDDDFDF